MVPAPPFVSGRYADFLWMYGRARLEPSSVVIRDGDDDQRTFFASSSKYFITSSGMTMAYNQKRKAPYIMDCRRRFLPFSDSLRILGQSPKRAFTERYFPSHHCAWSKLWPMGCPRARIDSPCLDHLSPWITPLGARVGSLAKVPSRRPSLFCSFSFMAVASCHIWRHVFVSCSSPFRWIRVLSSANCEMRWRVLPILTPWMELRLGSLGLSRMLRVFWWIKRYRGSAMTRNSRGLRGQPWATPE